MWSTYYIIRYYKIIYIIIILWMLNKTEKTHFSGERTWKAPCNAKILFLFTFLFEKCRLLDSSFSFWSPPPCSDSGLHASALLLLSTLTADLVVVRPCNHATPTGGEITAFQAFWELFSLQYCCHSQCKQCCVGWIWYNNGAHRERCTGS